MLYAAQDQAPSIEGTTCTRMHLRAHATTSHDELVEAAEVWPVRSTAAQCSSAVATQLKVQ